MRKNIVIGGYGGQGIMLAGGILCQAASIEGKNSTFFPSYGAEVRGGAAKCQVIISDEYIGSPIVKDIDIFVCFTSIAFKKYSKQVKRDGVVVLNSDIISNKDVIDLSENIKKICVYANTIADSIGNILFSNVVMLGAFVKNIGVLRKESVISAIHEAFVNKMYLLDINLLAFEKGYSS